MPTQPKYSVQNMVNNLNEKVDIIYKHQSLLSDYSSTPRDYGTGYLTTEVEMHTLGFIHDHDGINAAQLAIYTNRTKGAISQLLSKLESKGLIKRVHEPSNKRIQKLYLTEEGQRTYDIHRAYDRAAMLEMINTLLQDCTMGIFCYSFYLIHIFFHKINLTLKSRSHGKQISVSQFMTLLI